MNSMDSNLHRTGGQCAACLFTLQLFEEKKRYKALTIKINQEYLLKGRVTIKTRLILLPKHPEQRQCVPLKPENTSNKETSSYLHCTRMLDKTDAIYIYGHKYMERPKSLIKKLRLKEYESKFKYANGFKTRETIYADIR